MAGVRKIWPTTAACAGLLFWCAQTHGVTLGQSRSEVIAELGRPQAEMKGGPILFLTYPGGTLEFKDGKLQKIPPGFQDVQDEVRIKSTYENTQKAQKRVLVNGRWVSKGTGEQAQAQGALPAEYNRVAPAEPLPATADTSTGEGADIQVLDKQGKYFPVIDEIVLGRITIVVFFIPSDDACRPMLKWLEHTAKSDPRIALREVNIAYFESPIAHSYGIQSVPQVLVFDGQMQQLGPVTQDINTIEAYIASSQVPKSP